MIPRDCHVLEIEMVVYEEEPLAGFYFEGSDEIG
jgi:uncharacterized protein (DUF2237 family)